MRLLAEPGEVADQLAADAHGEEQREDEREEAEDARDTGLDEDVERDRVDTVAVAVVGVRDGLREAREQQGRGLLPAGQVDLRVLGGARGDDVLLGGAQRLGARGGPEPLEDLALAAGQVLQADLVQERAVGHQVDHLAQFVPGELGRGDQRGGDQRVLARQHLAGPGEAHDRAALLVHVHVLQGVEIGQERVAGLDDVAVRLQRPGAVEAAAVDLLPQIADAVELLEDGLQPRPGRRAQIVAHLGVIGGGTNLRDRAVGVPAAVLQRGERVGGPLVGQIDERLATLLLDDLDRVLHRGADLVHDVRDVQQLVGLAAGDVGRESPQGGEGDERHQQQRHDLPADGLPAKAHGLPQINRQQTA